MKSFFNWLTGRYEVNKLRPSDASKTDQAVNKAMPPHSTAGAGMNAQGVELKVKRHARREQLYGTIRDSMSRAGVLSASFKFKVLSLDQLGDKFLVMMDVAPNLARQADKLTEIEEQLTLAAKTQLGIVVTSVYWRADTSGSAAQLEAPNRQQPVATGLRQTSAQLPIQTSPIKPRHDPIHDEELAAFRQALAAASTQASSGKSRSGLRSIALLTGFEDTEMADEPALPALSSTQYGDLG